MNLEESMAKLNDRQREAVERVDGPLLVVAGPGTGKTQLLSLRAANILATCDVRPENILCLTYTEAGAEAMRKRLVELVGRDGYGIEVSTFHAFAVSVKSRYPEYFHRDPTAVPVSDLHAREIIDAFLKGLPYGSPLSGIHDDLAAGIGDVMGFISKMKRNSITPDEYRSIMKQNIAAADYLDGCDELMAALNEPLSRKKAEKTEQVTKFEELVLAACACAPVELRKPVVSTPGIYEPYISYLERLVSGTALIDGNSATGFTSIRDAEFAKNDDKVRCASIRKASEKALVACDAFEHYQRTLAAEGFIDFDDMVTDCIEAVEQSAELRCALQDRYLYIQVDEFQDTNGAQMRMVELLCEGVDEPNVMAVGDDDQAIMRFQGASVTYIEQFQERFSPHGVVLDINYRSTPEVVSLGMGVADQIERRLTASAEGKVISAFRKPEEHVEFHERVLPTEELEYQSLARDVKSRIDEGFVTRCKDPDDAIAVIACKHKGLRALIPFFVAENVPFSYTVKSNVFEMESMQTLLAMMRFVSAYSKGNRKLAESFLPQIVAAPELGGDHPSSVTFALRARCDHGGRWMRALEESENKRLRQLHDDLLEWSAKAPAAPVRELVFQIARRLIKHYAAMKDSDPYAYAEFNSGVRAILRFAEAELGTAQKLGRTLRLADVVERLDQAERFGTKIDAAINLGAPGAVRLTTAHGSKGLEFDLVYLLDADNGTWHSDRNSSGLYARNVLLADGKDPDDKRRLLFVAITRAKTHLELYRAGGSALSELTGEGFAGAIASEEVEFDAEDLAEAILTDWHDEYAFDTPELKELLKEQLPPDHLSASSLNAFVKYGEDGPEAEDFPKDHVLRLPKAPQIHFDFGNIVHAYLQDYVDHVLKGGGVDADELAQKRLEQVERMDYREEDVEQYVDRFKRIVGSFGAWAEGRLNGRMQAEVELKALAGDDVPLFGKCDLLLVDDDEKTVRVVDYKTGQGYPEGEPEPSYARQLRFYRLLVENSPEFAGYRVTSCENWYVEPEKGKSAIREPFAVSVSDEDIEDLTALMNAVWHRLCRADFDVSGFEGSDPQKEGIANGGRSKKSKNRALQHAFEKWLIEQDKLALP